MPGRSYLDQLLAYRSETHSMRLSPNQEVLACGFKVLLDNSGLLVTHEHDSMTVWRRSSGHYQGYYAEPCDYPVYFIPNPGRAVPNDAMTRIHEFPRY